MHRGTLLWHRPEPSVQSAARSAPVAFGPPPTADLCLAAQVRSEIHARRLRDDFFPSHLFADLAWDMLIDLFAADLEGQAVSISSACIASAGPATTALTYLQKLVDAGLVERHADPVDRRRIFVVITDHGRKAMHAWRRAVARDRRGTPSAVFDTTPKSPLMTDPAAGLRTIRLLADRLQDLVR